MIGSLKPRYSLKSCGSLVALLFKMSWAVRNQFLLSALVTGVPSPGA